jgi:hypothetical protein
MFCWQCEKDLGELSFEFFRNAYQGYIINGRRKVFCDENCYNEYWKRFYVETYKGNEIYKASFENEERYIPYRGCSYYFSSLQDCRNRIDQKNVSVMNPDMFEFMWNQF